MVNQEYVEGIRDAWKMMMLKEATRKRKFLKNKNISDYPEIINQSLVIMKNFLEENLGLPVMKTIELLMSKYDGADGEYEGTLKYESDDSYERHLRTCTVVWSPNHLRDQTILCKFLDRSETETSENLRLCVEIYNTFSNVVFSEIAESVVEEADKPRKKKSRVMDFVHKNIAT